VSGPTKGVRLPKPDEQAAIAYASYDKRHPAVTGITAEHRAVHEGMFYRASVYLEDIVNNGNSIYFALHVPPGTFPHIRLLRFTSSAGPGLWRFYEGVTFPGSPIGTPMDVRNGNRNTVNNSPSGDLRAGMVPYHTVTPPSPVNDGLLLDTLYLPGGGNRRTGVSGDDSGEEWVLKHNTDYMIEYVNLDGGANVDVNFQTLWYELDYGQ